MVHYFGTRRHWIGLLLHNLSTEEGKEQADLLLPILKKRLVLCRFAMQ
jgi:hypothetical protein